MVACRKGPERTPYEAPLHGKARRMEAFPFKKTPAPHRSTASGQDLARQRVRAHPIQVARLHLLRKQRAHGPALRGGYHPVAPYPRPVPRSGSAHPASKHPRRVRRGAGGAACPYVIEVLQRKRTGIRRYRHRILFGGNRPSRHVFSCRTGAFPKALSAQLPGIPHGVRGGGPVRPHRRCRYGNDVRVP